MEQMQTTLRFAVQSHVGLRLNNEDAAYAGPRLLALADGMGGHAAGEIASAIAIEEMVALDRADPSPEVLDDLRAAVGRANEAIAHRSRTDPETAGMGTTLTALLFDGDRVAVAHVGDSRAYVMREGSIERITRDDTLVQSLVDRGRLTEQEAWNHPQRNIVDKVLTGREVEAHLDTRETQPGDRYLICSDGLSDYVPEDEIADVLRLEDPLRIPQELIRVALRRQSQDNITCIVADVVDGASGYNIAIGTGAAADIAGVTATGQDVDERRSDQG
jgi:PPM family protein phosphatase